jgi:CheY-like chemotaxis protein
MSKISVLVADDNAPIREMLTTLLRRHFVVIEAVENGRQLVDSVLEREPDVVVSDVRMPVLDGVGAMRVLRDLGRTTPFVMLSADTNARPYCLRSGAAAFINKVDAATDLVAAVRAAAHGRTWDSSTRADGDLRQKERPAPNARR